MRFTRAFVRRLVLPLAVLTLPGCGPRWPKTYPVEGKVIAKASKLGKPAIKSRAWWKLDRPARDPLRRLPCCGRTPRRGGATKDN
jgi:hypothetical protein